MVWFLLHYTQLDCIDIIVSSSFFVNISEADKNPWFQFFEKKESISIKQVSVLLFFQKELVVVLIKEPAAKTSCSPLR
jgi:hypothetical protein